MTTTNQAKTPSATKIRVACKACGKGHQIFRRHRGRSFPCRKCSGKVLVPRRDVDTRTVILQELGLDPQEATAAWQREYFRCEACRKQMPDFSRGVRCARCLNGQVRLAAVPSSYLDETVPDSYVESATQSGLRDGSLDKRRQLIQALAVGAFVLVGFAGLINVIFEPGLLIALLLGMPAGVLATHRMCR